MSSPVATVRVFAERHQLWRPPLRVLAALSGGSDSVAMTFILHALALAGELELAGLAHVNHHVRGEASDGDEAFCRDLAARLGVPCRVAHADVPALAREHRQSLEVAGRHARHQALAAAAAELGAERIATAHTRNDQAETVLLHLMRGAGLSGARGIEPRSGARIRPVLSCTRDGLRAWLTELREPWREDATNDDVRNPRNRLRHAVLPELRAHFNPAVDAALARFADISREDDACLTAAAAAAAVQLIGRDGARVTVDADGLLAVPHAIARRVARLALETASGKQTYDLEEVDALIAACRTDLPAARDLPGVRMERSGDFVVLVHRQVQRPAVEAFSYRLPLPGEVVVAASGAEVAASARMTPEEAGTLDPGPSSEDRVIVSADELGDGVVVRSRQPGDRVRIARVGRKKLQDLFVDRKVAREARDQVPVVTDAHGRIVWVAGYAVAEEFRVGPLTSKVVILTSRLRKGAGRHR